MGHPWGVGGSTPALRKVSLLQQELWVELFQPKTDTGWREHRLPFLRTLKLYERPKVSPRERPGIWHHCVPWHHMCTQLTVSGHASRQPVNMNRLMDDLTAIAFATFCFFLVLITFKSSMHLKHYIHNVNTLFTYEVIKHLLWELILKNTFISLLP